MSKLESFYKSPNCDFTVVQGDCIETLRKFEFQFNMVFADPPYFLSNGGISIQSGKKVCVDKGEWDKSHGREKERAFTRAWLSEVREKLTPGGTIWISGTYHNSFILAETLEELGFKLLNAVTWVKTNPPPNLACRCLTHSSEVVLWARKSAKVAHRYNYDMMRKIAGNKQMRDVWELPAIAPWEKAFGKHPTQKPLALLVRLLLASTTRRDWVLDPFCGSGTTGIATSLLKRRFLGIDLSSEFLSIAQKRREELESPQVPSLFRSKIAGFQTKEQLETLLLEESYTTTLLQEPELDDLPF